MAWSTAASLEELAGAAYSAVPTDSHLSLDSGTTNVLPVITQIVNFTIAGNTSGEAPTFNTAPSDALIVFVELFGRTTVNNVTVEEGPNDTFVEQASLLD
ncbi:MAG: hypothetical protein WB782_07030 [Thermoplasmata archaeon]